MNSVQTAAGTFTYIYDEVGNITSISDGTYTTSYEYDDLNQLVRVNDRRGSATYTYEYKNGNILSQKQYAYTTGSLEGMSYTGMEYLYGDGTWSDVLTGFTDIQGVNGGDETSTASAYALQNTAETAQGIKAEGIFGRAMARKNSGVSTYSTRESAAPMFTYDAIGNPTNILGIEMVWNGRQLTELISPDDSYVSHVSYAYNTDGQRVSKTATYVEDQSTQTTEYFYNGSILAGQKTGDDTLVFMYDNNGDYFGFTVNGTPYYYVKNAQNDVLAVTDASGEILLYYRYDAWGQFYIDIVGSDDAAVEEAYLNPITYRSYYIDLDSGFYYLNSRYYISMFCRFLNADGVVNANQDILGNNLFAYCSNDPVNNCDDNGCGKISNWFKNTVQTVKNWWNSTPPAHSYTIPASYQIVGKVSDAALGATANYTGKFSKVVNGIITYTKNYSKSARAKFYPAGESIKPYTGASKVVNKVSAIITCTTLALDLGNTWTENNGNTNGDRVIKSAIQIGGVIAGIGVGAIAAAVAGPSVAGVAAFIGIVTVGGIVIDQASLYLTNKAGIE